MSLDAWNQLQELEQAIDAEFGAPNAAVQACPAGPQVHLLYAHYGALPDPGKQVAQPSEQLPTLKKYEDVKSAGETPSPQAALSFFAAHLLWMRTPGVVVDKLPEPPLKATPDATDAKDGGTLAHFLSNNWPAHPTDSGGHALPFKVKATTPTRLDDPTFIDGYAATAGAPAIETSAGYPTKRLLCLSIPGDVGDHQTVDAAAAPATAELAYGKETDCGSLRLFAVSPAFKFELRTRAPKAAHGKPAPAAPAPVPVTTDPWTTTTRSGIHTGTTIWETSSAPAFTIGSIQGSAYGTGLVRFHDGTYTSIDDVLPKLGGKGASPIGRHRTLIFKAFNDIEGPCEALNTYDSGILSWGINQWTAAGGELLQLVCFMSDFYTAAFARRFRYYGIGAWFDSRSSTWKKNPYETVKIYRVPCCGPKISAAIDAINNWEKEDAQALAAAQAAAKKRGKRAPTALPARAADLPPRHLTYLADTVPMRVDDFATLAACYVFATAGGDDDIQRAQAQWMSFRISWAETLTHYTSDDFLSEHPSYLWGPEPIRPPTPAGQPKAPLPAAGRQPKPGTLGAMVAQLIDSLGAASDERAKRHYKAQQNLRAAVPAGTTYDALMDETFVDTDTSDDWKDWATACKNAGKTTV